MGDVGHFVILSALVMGLAHTLTKERIFAPLRERLGGRDTWFGYLVSCPYCASHWIAFALVPLTGASFVPIADALEPVASCLDWFLSSILVTVGAAFLRVVFYFVDESQGLVRERGRQEKRALHTGDAQQNGDADRSPGGVDA
jgi:hypothetical protein